MIAMKAYDGTPGFIVDLAEVPEAYWEIYDRAWKVETRSTTPVPPDSIRHATLMGGARRNDGIHSVWIPVSYFINELGIISL